MRAYKVKVETTNASDSCFCINHNQKDERYLDCTKGIIIVITDNPEKIYKAWGKDVILNIERAEQGYYIH